VTTRFRLASMDMLLSVFTWIVLAIPVVIGFAGWSSPVPIRPILLGTVVFMVAIYAFVWLWMRPKEIVVSPDGLELVWPVRRRTIPASAIVRARILDRAQLREELGRMMRIGAGGLWGGFGLARTSRGTLELWVSRVDWMVYVECEGRRGLLLTPDEPERFVAEVTKLLGRG
jgi:PH (Pleckstrin Homology) domain-containing protein